MNDIEDENGRLYSQLKLVRNDFAYTNTAFDTNGSNDYSTSSIKNTLNNNFLNNISSNEKNIIANIAWNLGGISSSDFSSKDFYYFERGLSVYSGHSKKWIGKIGLIYPSDFGFAAIGNNSIARKKCISLTLGAFQNNNDCYNNDYIYNSEQWQWTIMPNSKYSNITMKLV